MLKTTGLTLVVLLGLAGCNNSGQDQSKVAVIEYSNSSRKAIQETIRQEVANHKTPILYFYADWCGPCRRFRASLSDEQLEGALSKATLIKINVDSCGEMASAYSIDAVPTFVKVDADGQVVAKITSDKWAEDIPSDISPVMKALATSTEYDMQ
jgi:thioredoxin 1